MAQKQMRTLGDILDAIMELLKLQSTDLVSRGRIQRDVTRAYINEVMPYGDWPWRRRKVQVQTQAYHATGLSSVTLDSVTVTLDTTLANSRTGYLFSVTGENDVYRIKSHVAGTGVLTLDSPYINHSNSTAAFKIWSDSVPLPADLEEVKEITSPNFSKPLVGVGLQEFRRIQSSNPKAEGRPYYFTLDDWKDPEPYSIITGLPTSTFRSATGLVRTIRFASTLGATEATALLKVGDRIQISGSSSYSYNIEAIVSAVSSVSVPNDTITFTALESITEASTSDISLIVKKMNSEGYERQKHLLIYPSIYTTKTNLAVDYQCELPAFSDETDEPTMPMADRVVLYWLGLSYAYARERNPEESMLYRQLAEQRLGKMNGRTTESMDKPSILPSNLYLANKRNSHRYRSRGSSAESFGATGGSSSNPTGNTNTVAVFGPNQTLQSSSVTVGDLNTLSDIDNTKQIEGRFVYLENLITNTTYNDLVQTLTNKTLDADENTIFNIDDNDIKALAGIQVSKLQAVTPVSALVSDVDGFVSASVTSADELAFVSGVTSSVQDQLDAKLPIDAPTYTDVLTTPLTASRAAIINADQELDVSTTTDTELGYVAGVTSSIQDQLDLKAPLDSPVLTTPDIGAATGTSLQLSGLTASSAVATDASKNLVSVANTGTGDNVLSTSPVLVTPDLGTPSALVGTNITGTAAGLTAGTVTTNANLTGPITSVGNATAVASQTGTGSTFVMNTSPTLVTPELGAATGVSLQLSGLTASSALATDASKNLVSVTNTGTGNNVLATSPTLVTPALGTPSAAVLTNATGLPLATGVTGQLPIANGGTGQATKAAAFDALSPMTTGGDLIYGGASGTATRLANGTAGQVLTSAGTTLAPIWADSAGGSGSGGINYLSDNPEAIVDTSGWSTYADAAQNTPVNGTGGSPTSTWTRTTSTPLRGVGSFLWTRGAANRQGEGVSYDFTIDEADKAKPLAVSFDYSIASGTFFAADGITAPLNDGTTSQNAGMSDLEVFVYDVTNGILVPVSPQVLTSSASLPATFKGTFQTNPNSTSYRLILHTARSTAVAFTAKFDNFIVGPQAVAYGAAVSDWNAFTPTSSWVSNTTHTGQWRRVGDNMEIRYFLTTTGAPTATPLILNLPSGYTMDTAKVLSTATFTTPLATGTLVNNSGTGYGLFPSVQGIYHSSNQIRVFSIGSQSGSGTTSAVAVGVNQVNPFTFANTDNVTMVASVPISGWSSTVQMSNDTDTRVIAFKNLGNPTGTLAAAFNTISWPASATLDTAGGWDGSSNYRVPVSGVYRVIARVSVNGTFTLGNSVSLQVVKNGVSQAVDTARAGGAITNTSASVASLFRAAAGDTIAINAFCDATTPTYAGTTTLHEFSVERLTGPASIASTETVAAAYTSTAGQAFTNSAVILPFPTKDYDSHGAYNPSTGIFTAPISGKYRISSSVQCNFSVSALSNAIVLYVYKNGALYRQLDLFGATSTTATSQCLKGSTCVPLLAGDTLDIRILKDSGHTVSVNTSAATVWMNVERVGN